MSNTRIEVICEYCGNIFTDTTKKLRKYTCSAECTRAFGLLRPATIYLIKNLETGACYVGKTSAKNPLSRWSGHKYAAYKKNIRYHLYNAMRKYGLEAFEFSVIENCDNATIANDAERRIIAEYKAAGVKLYNQTDGGEGTPGIYRDEKWSKNHSEVMRGHVPWNKGLSGSFLKQSEEYQKRLKKEHTPKPKKEPRLNREPGQRRPNASKGKKRGPRPPEVGEKIGNALRGRPNPKNRGPKSPETREKMRQAAIRREQRKKDLKNAKTE